MERFADATYLVRLRTEALEKGGGKGVAAADEIRVSALPFVVGVKPDGDLDYISMGSQRGLSFLALNPRLDSIAVESLVYTRFRQVHVSVLTRQSDGRLAYESVLKQEEEESGRAQHWRRGLGLPVEHGRPERDVRVGDPRSRRGATEPSNLFSVVGKGDPQRSLERNAELGIKLARDRWKPGEEMEISITAPYAGAGRDYDRWRLPVYLKKWGLGGQR